MEHIVLFHPTDTEESLLWPAHQGHVVIIKTYKGIASGDG